MKKRSCTRWLCMLLCFALLLSALPAYALATDTDTLQTTETTGEETTRPDESNITEPTEPPAIAEGSEQDPASGTQDSGSDTQDICSSTPDPNGSATDTPDSQESKSEQFSQPPAVSPDSPEPENNTDTTTATDAENIAESNNSGMLSNAPPLASASPESEATDIAVIDTIEGEMSSYNAVLAAAPTYRVTVLGQSYRPSSNSTFYYACPYGYHGFEMVQFRRVTINGVQYPAYCINPGQPAYTGSFSGIEVGLEDSWNYYLSANLTSDQQEAIGVCLLYGYPNKINPSDIGDRAGAEIATQIIIWELILGLRSTTAPYPCSNSGLIKSYTGTAVYNGYSVTKTREYYDQIEADLQNHGKILSFSSRYPGSAPTHTMSAKGDGTYTLTLTDTNNILDKYTFTNGNGLSYSKNGNTLTITASGPIASGTTVAPTKQIPQLENASYLILHNGGTYQTNLCMPCSVTDDPVPTYFKLKIPTGTVSIQKKTSTNTDLGNWTMSLMSGSTVVASGTTDSNGKLTLSDIAPGTYTLVETVPADSKYMCTNNNQTVTVTAGQTTSVTVNNTLKAGKLSLTKQTNTGNDLGNWQFGVYSDAACTNLLTTLTTNSSGVATSGDLSPGTVYVKEISTRTGWITDTSVKSVTIVSGQTVNVTGAFYNKQVGHIQVNKSTNTGANLGGWKVNLYDASNTLISTYTIPDSGTLTISNLLPGTYYLQEADKGDGYWVCDTALKTVTVTAGQTATVSLQNTHRGLAKVVKTTNTGSNLDGWQFGLYADLDCTQLKATITSDSSGNGSTYIEPGTYWVKEIDYYGRTDEYWTFDSEVKQIEITAGAETSVTFTNTQHGKILIKKEMATDGPVLGWEYIITRLSDNANMGTFTTQDDGTILTGKLLPGKYKIEEVIPANSLYYCKSDNPITVSVNPGQTTTATFTNALRPGRIEIEKTDPFGNHLSGVKFLLEWSMDGTTWTPVTYSDNADVIKGGCSTVGLTDGTLTTDSSGIIAFENLYPGLQYRVTELETVNGYLLLTDYAFVGELPIENLEVKLQVVNNPGYMLPYTGSHGTDLPVLLGAGLVAIAMAMLIITATVASKSKITRKKSTPGNPRS